MHKLECNTYNRIQFGLYFNPLDTIVNTPQAYNYYMLLLFLLCILLYVLPCNICIVIVCNLGYTLIHCNCIMRVNTPPECRICIICYYYFYFVFYYMYCILEYAW